MKLICTPFTYLVPSWFPTFRGEIQGSYLGRKPAKEGTLKKFMMRNGAPSDVSIIRIGDSFESPYVSK